MAICTDLSSKLYNIHAYPNKAQRTISARYKCTFSRVSADAFAPTLLASDAPFSGFAATMPRAESTEGVVKER